jgi:RNA polymerase sigma-70 factor (ECF subfamily)
MDHHTVRSLIDQSKSGDKRSFRKIVELNQGFAYAVAFRLLCNDYETEETVQEAFIRVWKHLDDFNPDMQFRTWLYKIVVNLCYDRMKAAKITNAIQPDLESSFLLNLPSSENIEAGIINRETAQIIRYLTANLTPKQRLVFTLVELEGLTSTEVVEISGLTPEKIKSNLYCARQVIRKKLECLEENKNADV